MTEPILTPFLGSQDITVYQGDCIQVMRQMPENSVDAIVTDPPYGLEFMGKDWDGFGTPLGFQTWTEAWAREAFRVLKPGGHLLAFAGTRTYHRMASGVEDAGFEIRDCIAWMYGSGFPKSLDVSKAIDKAAGAERDDIYEDKPGVDNNLAYGKGLGVGVIERRPATPEAARWNGWGTALKPAFEPVVLARKPLIGTVAQNVLEHGTGALNIDGCRIGISDSDAEAMKRVNTPGSGRFKTTHGSAYGVYGPSKAMDTTRGRWPANVTLDEDAAAMLDEQTGNVSYNPSGVFGKQRGDQPKDTPAAFAIRLDGDGVFGYGDRGGPSRFFYCAKASKKDRNTNGAANTHPTVKPTALMRWLIRLATPPGGIILDPFGGSGSTGVAARAEGVRCILIEREAEYLDIIRQRLDEGPLFANLD
jgi:site-specific DNA-methyltransferase (adenine-specific)